MRLRNKKTGKVIECFNNTDGILPETLAKLSAEYEDAPEEPKVGYIIDPMEEDYVSADCSGYEESDVERAKELGIWFETEEEAEKAVEKLKAWKRLKDKGFRFKGYTDDSGDLFSCQVIRCSFDDFWYPGKESREDLDLLFGGEE